MYTKENIKKEYLKGESLRYSETKNIEIYEYIENNVPLNIIHKEKIYCYINNIEPRCNNPQCKTLKYPKFQNFKLGYKDFCSVSCSVICSKHKQEETRIKNIQESTNILTPEEIVQKLYTKELKVQKWRDIGQWHLLISCLHLQKRGFHLLALDKDSIKPLNMRLSYFRYRHHNPLLLL